MQIFGVNRPYVFYNSNFSDSCNQFMFIKILCTHGPPPPRGGKKLLQ
jgi:hypothetical protein